MKLSLVYTTVGNRRDAERLAIQIVKKRLAACANFFKIGSFYWWQGKLTQDSEYAIIFKTPARNYARFEKELLRHHPYELPAIVAIPIEKGFKKYLSWIAAEVIPKKGRVRHKGHKEKGTSEN